MAGHVDDAAGHLPDRTLTRTADPPNVDTIWMVHVLLYAPEIPPNTGNIIRLCANTGTQLHLIDPLGFELDDARLRRAGLDYHEYTTVLRHASFDACLEHLGPTNVYAFTTQAQRRFDQPNFKDGDALLFGSESRIRERYAAWEAWSPGAANDVPTLQQALR